VREAASMQLIKALTAEKSFGTFKVFLNKIKLVMSRK
jgi:hypothetical protein